MTVRMLLASLSSYELTEWQAFFALQRQAVPEEDVESKLQKSFGRPGDA
jgi:hypothetical protein